MNSRKRRRLKAQAKLRATLLRYIPLWKLRYYQPLGRLTRVGTMIYSEAQDVSFRVEPSPYLRYSRDLYVRRGLQERHT